MNHDQPTDDRHARERTGTSPPLFTYVTGPICVRIQDISPSVAWYLWSYVRVAYSTLGPLKALYLACIHTQFRLGTSLVAFTNFRAFCVFVFYRCAFSTVVHLKGVGQLLVYWWYSSYRNASVRSPFELCTYEVSPSVGALSEWALSEQPLSTVVLSKYLLSTYGVSEYCQHMACQNIGCLTMECPM